MDQVGKGLQLLELEDSDISTNTPASHPLMNRYILEKIFMYFDNKTSCAITEGGPNGTEGTEQDGRFKVKALKNLRLVCKTWNEESFPILLKHTWINNIDGFNYLCEKYSSSQLRMCPTRLSFRGNLESIRNGLVEQSRAHIISLEYQRYSYLFFFDFPEDTEVVKQSLTVLYPNLKELRVKNIYCTLLQRYNNFGDSSRDECVMTMR